jgi:hypothetical protein
MYHIDIVSLKDNPAQQLLLSSSSLVEMLDTYRGKALMLKNERCRSNVCC